MGGWGLQGLVLVLQLVSVQRSFTAPDTREVDWSQCPLSCKCTWVGGKRSADCQDAGLSVLPRFSYADQIQVLHLAANPLRSLPETVFNHTNLINLQKVYLQNCSLTVVHPTAFFNLVLMIELDLSHNNIRILPPGLFEGNIRIRKLWLHHNPIRSLQDFSFPAIKHLRSLDLSSSLIRKIGQDTFTNIDLIEVLSLSDNQLHRLDPAAFRTLVNLKSLKLSRNPWHCDCRLDSFWHWVMAQNLFNNPTICETPSKLVGQSWDDLTQSDLACPPRVSVRQPERSVTLGAQVLLSCFIVGPNKRVNWVRSGFIVKNNSLSLDGGTQSYVLRSEKVSNRRLWLNLTIGHVDRSGSGVYSCVAESEGGMTEKNATIVITDSSTYLGKKELNLVWVGVASFLGVFVTLFGAMTCYAIREKNRRRHSLLAGHSEGSLKPGESSVIFTRAMDMKCDKGNYDSPVVTDMLERDRDLCNSSNSNNSGYSGDDSGVGSSSSNILRLEQQCLKTPLSNSGGPPSKVHFPDVVKLPISEEDMKVNKRVSIFHDPDPSGFNYQPPQWSSWGASSDSTTSLMRADSLEPQDCSRDTLRDREISLPRRLPSQPTKPNSSSLQRRCRAEDSSLPRRQENSLPRRQEPRGSAWNHLPSSLTDTDFELMKQELAARKLCQRAGGSVGRQAFLLTRPSQQEALDRRHDSRSQLLNALVQDHSDTVV